MKKYIGTKTIMAKPMAKSEAEKVLNRSLADALTRLLTHASTVCVLSMPMSRSAF